MADHLADHYVPEQEAGPNLSRTTVFVSVPPTWRAISATGSPAAGIPKRDERDRSRDVHALRTTFGTLLSKGGSPRTAQAAMPHRDIKLTAV